MDDQVERHHDLEAAQARGATETIIVLLCLLQAVECFFSWEDVTKGVHFLWCQRLLLKTESVHQFQIWTKGEVLSIDVLRYDIVWIILCLVDLIIIYHPQVTILIDEIVNFILWLAQITSTSQQTHYQCPCRGDSHISPYFQIKCVVKAVQVWYHWIDKVFYSIASFEPSLVRLLIRTCVNRKLIFNMLPVSLFIET